MRVAVYDRYWSTGGGGERYGGAIAAALGNRHEVDLLSEDDVHVAWLAERLHIDLGEVGTRRVQDRPGAVERASADYDLFVNVTHGSIDRNRAARGVYVVHFPSPPLQIEGLGSGSVRVALGEGFHPAERDRPRSAWTSGDASVLVTGPPGVTVPIELVFAHRRPPSLGATTVRIGVDGEEIEWVLSPRGRVPRRWGSTVRLPVRGRDDGHPVVVRIRSDTFRPDQVTGSDDSRVLGVPLRTVRVGRGPWARRGGGPAPEAVAPVAPACLRSYDAVVTYSAFAQGWIARRWGVDSVVLHPSARPGRPGKKEPIIVAIGRFFPPALGHCKRQLEMVSAFRRLCAGGLEGWTLHLAGGAERGGTAYLDEVRRAAEGLPVEFHIDAAGVELEALLSRASLFWLATGVGEDIAAQPERFEHFGIATVEAMSAGAVPVVIGQGGPLEVVRHGVDGYHFHDLDELVSRTAALAADAGLRERMSAAAVERAAEFSDERFSERLRVLVDRIVAEPPSPRPEP